MISLGKLKNEEVVSWISFTIIAYIVVLLILLNTFSLCQSAVNVTYPESTIGQYGIVQMKTIMRNINDKDCILVKNGETRQIMQYFIVGRPTDKIQVTDGILYRNEGKTEIDLEKMKDVDITLKDDEYCGIHKNADTGDITLKIITKNDVYGKLIKTFN